MPTERTADLILGAFQDEMVTRREIISPTVSRGGGTSRPSRGETSGASSGGRGGY